MKRLIILLLLVAVGFYAGWPAWSGYQIKSALDRGDAATLRDKIDFASVRLSLRPAARRHAERMLEERLQSGGPVSTVLDDDTRSSLLPRIVDSTLDRLVTPENLIRIARHGGTIKDAVSGIVKQQMGGALGGLAGLEGLGRVRLSDGEDGQERSLDIGGLVGGIVGAATGRNVGDLARGGAADEDEASEPAPAAAAPSKNKKRSYGLGNIKSVGFAGPLGVKVGVAQNPNAKVADLTAEMGFRGLDWKLVALRPRY